MNGKRKKTIGIIGGMGPLATVDMFNQIVRGTQADEDQEHIHILIDCNPQIPDRTNAILGNGASPLPHLIASAQKLQAAGADFLLIACNTSHYYYNELRREISIPILSMIQETAREIAQRNIKTAIVLTTDGARKAMVYDSILAMHHIKAVYPGEILQSAVTDIIYNGVKAGLNTKDASLFNQELALLEGEYNAITILGCTELPVAVEQYQLKGNFLNPTTILARAAIREAGYPVAEKSAGTL